MVKVLSFKQLGGRKLTLREDESESMNKYWR